jgi:hypothetical protein
MILEAFPPNLICIMLRAASGFTQLGIQSLVAYERRRLGRQTTTASGTGFFWLCVPCTPTHQNADNFQASLALFDLPEGEDSRCALIEPLRHPALSRRESSSSQKSGQTKFSEVTE